MSSKRHVRRRACRGKRKYPDMQTAQIRAHIASQRAKAKINAYRCANCGSFHIGHAPAVVNRRIGP